VACGPKVRQKRADHGVCLNRRALLEILSDRSNADLRPLIVCTISSAHAYIDRYWTSFLDTATNERANEHEQDVLASFGLSASNSYRLFPPSRETRCTTMRNAAEDDLPDWHETTLLMWYDDVLPLSKTTLAALLVVGMICTPPHLTTAEVQDKVRVYVREYTARRLQGCVRVSRRSSASFCTRCTSTIRDKPKSTK
jgi:hypothetical protein